MNLSLEIYHRMPFWLQGLTASARGYYLNKWRYDKDTDRRVNEALEREYWSATEWKTWREKRLSFILERAVRKVPYYRESWKRRRQNGYRGSCEYLENWPILDKQTLRRRAEEFVADDRHKKSLFCDHTSGTTGTPLRIWSSADVLRDWYALFEARTRVWFGLSRKDRWGILGGQLIVPFSRQKPPFWVWNAGMQQLYMSSYHLSSELVLHYANAMRHYRVRYLLGYSSALYELAHGLLRQKLERPKLDIVITNAEPLFAHQRDVIANAFNCEVKETYGMAEMVAAASECEHGKLHEWPDAGFIERPTVGIESLKFVCTGLLNDVMPLIRYEVGDTGSFSANTCPCGRNLPVVNEIEGRSDDLLVTVDGRRIGRLDPIFKSDLPIHEAQIIQKTLKTIIVKLVPDGEFNRRTSELIADRLRERMGEVTINFEIVEKIPRTSNGKLRAVICEMPSDAEELQRSV